MQDRDQASAQGGLHGIHVALLPLVMQAAVDAVAAAKGRHAHCRDARVYQG